MANFNLKILPCFAVSPENRAFSFREFTRKGKCPIIRKNDAVNENLPQGSECHMKKILIITNHSYMLYRFRRELIRQLMQSHEVVLCMPFVGHEDDFKAMGLRCIETAVERRGTNPVTDMKLLKTYKAILKQEKPDLVVTYSIKPNIYAGMACEQLHIPYCVNVQGLGTAFQKKGIAQMVSVLYRMALRRAKVVFFENQGNADYFTEHHIIRPEKVKLLNGAGINLEDFPLVPYPKNDKLHFLYLGRIMREKGIDELFSAIRRLHEELGDRVVLDLVGFFEDDYQGQIDELTAQGIAVFHGFQSEPRPYYAETDCVVLPSYHEGLSNVLLESAATGRPVITSKIHGCLEAVEDGKSGLLCTVRDADSLYEQMRRFAGMSRQEREDMGLAGRAYMEAKFDKKIVVKETTASILK